MQETRQLSNKMMKHNIKISVSSGELDLPAHRQGDNTMLEKVLHVPSMQNRVLYYKNRSMA